jgi:hypothetical protein
MGDIDELYGRAVNPNEHEDPGFEPIPPDWYPMLIDKAEIKGTKDGTGKILKIEYTVLGDKYNGRKLFVNINLVNRNEQAMQIGLRELASLERAIGIDMVVDSSQLIGQQVLGKVKVTAATDQYEASNDVVGYKALGVGTTVAPAIASVSRPAAPVAAQAELPGVPAPVVHAAAPAPTPVPAAGARKRPWQR